MKTTPQDLAQFHLLGLANYERTERGHDGQQDVMCFRALGLGLIDSAVAEAERAERQYGLQIQVVF